MLENALEAVTKTRKSLERSIECVKVDAAAVRYALRHGGDADISIPNDELRMLLTEQVASLLIATENLMQALGRKHSFEIRGVYPPLDPTESEELVAKVWGKIWPDQSYPRLNQLTSEQRYFAFGPGKPPASE
jgi:hypothetical protein